MTTGPLDLAVSLAQVFEALDIPYVVGGSVASSLVGEPRSTVDIDIAVELDDQRLGLLLEQVRPTFYVPEADAIRAVIETDSFNIIHNDEAFKVDLFVLGSGHLDRRQIDRRIAVEVPTDPPALLWVTSPEDQVLRKLDWYRQGGGTSDRQWRDVVAILNINAEQLDSAYMSATADLVGLTSLLLEAIAAAH